MKPHIEARIREEKITNTKIQQSFCKANFDNVFIEEMKLLVLDDVHVSELEIKRRGWQAIHSDNNSGEISMEHQPLIDWWKDQKISPIYATSRQRLVEHQDNKVLVMELTEVNASTLNEIDLGMWMFGEIPDLAAQRISDWRADIWFSNPLEFIVLSEHGGYGTTTIAGPAELIESVKALTNHEEYQWKPGVVPDWNKGAAFSETTIPPKE